MITQTINLNMTPGVVVPRIWASQNDSGSRAFVFYLFNGSTPYYPASSVSVLLNGIKPDGTTFSYACSLSGYTVSADCTEQMTAVVGNVECEIRIVDANQDNVGSANFILAVEVDPQELASVSENELAALAVLTAQGAAHAAEAAAEAATAQSAAESLSGAVADVAQHTQEISALQEETNTLQGYYSGISGLLNSLVVVRDFRQTSISVGANASGNVTFDLTYNGYMPVAIHAFAVTGSAQVYFYNVNINDNAGTAYYHNTGSAGTIGIVIRVTYVKTNVYGGVVT